MLRKITEKLAGLIVGEAARRLGEPPKRITDGFYRRWFDNDLCPVVAGRRLIPEDYLPRMATILRERARPRSRKDAADLPAAPQ
jgi:hypothetical protein